MPRRERGRATRTLDLDELLAGEPATTAHQRDPGALEPADLSGVVESADHGVSVNEDSGDVELAGRRLPAARHP